MIRIILPLICAALGFAAASCSQSEGPPAAEAPASPAQGTHDAASPGMTSPADLAQAPPADAPSTTPASPSAADSNPDVPTGTPTERRASTLIGMAVVGTDGTSLGKVKDIIFDRQGRATHIVIAYGTQPQQTNPAALPNDGVATPPADGKLTAMPWDAAMASIKDGQLVLDSARLQAAPSYAPGARHNLDDPDWNAPADAYWRKAVQEAIEAHPGAPIDSPSRSRDRPDRDDE